MTQSPSNRTLRQKTGHRNQGFLMRLLRSRTGNVLPIVAAGLVPMAAMVGGAVDMSRAYMVKARLQQACDAGVLAGRRAMAQAQYDIAAKNTAKSFFDVNFVDGYQSTTDLRFVSTNQTGSSKVEGNAEVNVPTTIMAMFGKEVIPVEVICEAELNVSNSDITFVLDTTGSMSGSISNGAGGTEQRIQALRSAVVSFYDVLATASAGSNARLRYGFVPYSAATNVGELLYDKNPQFLLGGNTGENWNYESRRPIFEVTQTVTTPDSSETEVTFETYGTTLNRDKCRRFGDNLNFNQGGGWNHRPSPQGATVTSGDTTITYERHRWNGDSEPWNGGGRRSCERKVTTTTVTPGTSTTTTIQTPVFQAGARFHHWEYLERTYAVNDFVRSIKSTNPAVILPTEVNTSFDRWDGCIEERGTVAANDFSFVVGSGIVPNDGSTNDFDLDLDLTPSDAATKWKPFWNDVYYRRDGGRSVNCPRKAQLLNEMTRNEVVNYTNALNTGGNTYHDIGLIWGGRISSPNGIFKDNVIAPPNNSGTVQRHIIFMTDGELATSNNVFTSYGNEPLDRRISGGSNSPSTQERHRRRFLAVCEAIKGKGIRLWTIAFGTTLTADLERCSSSGSAFPAQDSAQLEAQFRNIASQIAELRLTD